MIFDGGAQSARVGYSESQEQRYTLPKYVRPTTPPPIAPLIAKANGF